MRRKLVDVTARESASFPLPSQQARERLRRGDYAKVVLGHERLWLRVAKVLPGGGYEGTLASHPVDRELGKHGDTLTFEPRHVCAITTHATPGLDSEPDAGEPDAAAPARGRKPH